ncbi:hypothetical protein KAI87_11515, partial [Myxococcota bacterium]|nr:hypothetical protein [Myxococcota bacterium]
NTAEVSVTFDRAMDTAQGRLEIEGQLFDDKVELTIDDTDLNWNAAGTQLILTVGEPDPNQESVILRFKDLYKANGDKAPDVDVSYIFNRSDAPDSLAPVIDLPHLAGTEPLSFDPTLPYIWFSESVDPATLNHITATNVATSATIDLGVEPGFQRSAFISTAEMQPGEEYEITVGTSLLDAAATAIESENTFTIQIPADYDFGTPTIFGLSDGETDMPIRDLDLYVEFPGGFEPTSISNEDVKLYATTTGEPVRGMHIEVPNTFEGVTGLKISMSAGMRALRTNTEYTLELSGITATGGHEYFSSAPLAFSFTTVDSGSTGMPENARPLFDLEDTSISVSAGDSGPTAEATALILDDDGSFTVSLSGVGYEFSAELEVDADDPMRFELPEGTLIEDSAFTTGWNDMELSINDGTHTVSVILAVYFMPTEEIPEITSPTMSAVLDPADISTLTFDWTHVTGDPALQILVLANMDQGEMSFLDWAFLDPAVDSFPAGERFARHLQPGHNYGLFVIKLVTRFGFQGAGSAMIMGESVIIFSILDPTLGSISGSINLLAPIATAPVILAAHTADDLANGLFVASAYAVEGTDELTWDYFMPNLDDGDYYLTVWVDVLGNDVESDQTTHEDNVGAVYHEGNLIDPATIASAADLTSIDIDLLNWPGRIDVSITSDHAIEGKIQIILCPTGLGRPDASCQWKSNREMNGAQNYDQTLYNIEDGDYEVWAHYDVDGDETLDLLSIGDPAPVTISADTQDVLFDLVIPQGSVSGAITLNMSMPGAKVMAFVFAEGESFDDTVQHFVIAENPSGDGINFSYTVPYIENGTHDIYVAVDYDSDDDADAIGDPWPATVSITGNDATQDFTVDIPVGDLSGTTTSITGTISDEVWVVAYYRGADRATDEPIFVVLATDSGDQKEFSWALNDMPQADYDLYTDLDSDIDGVFDPDAGSATCIAAQVNVPDFSGTPVIMGFLDI